MSRSPSRGQGPDPEEALASQLRRYSGQVRQLTEQVVPALTASVADLSRQLEQLRDDGRRGTEELGRQRRRLAELERAVRGLGRGLAWVERHLRSTGSAAVLDLDRLVEQAAEAGQRVRDAERARAELADAGRRAALERTLAEHRDAVADRDRAVAAVLACSAELVARDWSDPGHPKACADHRQAAAEWAAARERAEGLADAARAAAAELAEDDGCRRAAQPVLDLGDAERRALTGTLGRAVAEAVAAGQLLPVWVHDRLGPAPSEHLPAWVEAVAELALFRAAFGVRDPVRALGDPVAAAADPARRAWAARIEARIAALDS